VTKFDADIKNKYSSQQRNVTFWRFIAKFSDIWMNFIEDWRAD